MKNQRIYLDTSVIGGCFDKEFRVWSNGLFRDFEKGLFKAVISELVSDEIELAPNIIKEKYAELIGFEPEIIEVTKEALELLSKYQERNILGVKFRNDMLHISIATIAEVDILTSWNFKHIVHFDKIRAFNSVNLENGYKQLEIFSPREVTSYGSD